MKKPILLTLLALLVAAFALFCLAVLLAGYIMRDTSAVWTEIQVALVVIGGGLLAALIFAWRPGWGRTYAAALAVMLVAGIGANVYDWQRSKAVEERRKARETAERQAIEGKFLSQLDAYRKEVAERIAAKRPFAPQQGLQFLDFVQGSDFSYRLLPDYSPQTFPLLKQALDEKIFDPNARVKGWGARDTDEEEPIFVAYYKFYLRSGATMHIPRVRERDWTIFQMMIAAGANLDDPAVGWLRDVAKRQTEPYDPNVRGYVRLK